MLYPGSSVSWLTNWQPGLACAAPAPPVRVFNSRALLPSYLCFSYKTTITHAKYQFHFKRAGSKTIARTMLLKFAGKHFNIKSGGYSWLLILRILSAGDNCGDWTEKVRSGSHDPDVWQDAESSTGFLRWERLWWWEAAMTG